MILKIAIADKNSEYIRRILNVLETYGDIDVSVFTDEKSLEGALDNRKFDVLLFDESKNGICRLTAGLILKL